jgi:hypothetical protein
MSNSQKEINPQKIREAIFQWLKSRLDADAVEWLKLQRRELVNGAEDWKFFTSFSAAPRHTGKEPLGLTAKEQEQAEKLRAGWTPAHWSVDQLARAFLVLTIAEKDKEKFLELLDKTFVSSDMGEAEALYQTLPILPYPEELTDRAAEGIRSNMTSVFNAVALRNPYPAEYMDEDAFNQVVLKALFVESPLYLIRGIDDRRNAKLAEMLVDYAHERWAAERSVSPELWRPVGPYGDKYLDDLKRVLEHPDEIQKQAAILALSDSSSSKAKELVEQHEEIVNRIEEENINWDTIGLKVNTETEA